MQHQLAISAGELQICPDPEEIKRHLQSVLRSTEFTAAPRLSRFLEFVVETTLAGNSDVIKESLIAIEVYRRRPDYNPQIDSTVRVEAGRLRARLRQYYEATGASDTLRIELPKGTYVPSFHVCAPAVQTVSPGEHRPAMQWRPRWLLAVGLSIVAAAMIAIPAWSSRDAGAIDSIAVLPLVNLSDDSVAERLSESLTEELTTRLARDARVRVTSRTTMARYKNVAADISGMGREHGVRAVLEGSVRRDGDRLIVTTQLIDTADGYHLWADRFERSLSAPAGSHGDLAAGIVSRLRTVVESGPVRQHRRPDPDAKTMEIYHRAQDLLRIPVLKNGPPEKLPDSVVESVRLFRDVTSRSPEFAQGWAGLAEAAEWEYELRGNQPRERLVEATTAARRAVALAPDLVDGWTVLTSILFYREWDFGGAEAAARRVIELDPRNTSARQRLVDILRVQGRAHEARFQIEQAVKLQPAAAKLRARRAAMLYEAGEFDEALREARAAGELTNQIPVHPLTVRLQGLCLEQTGQFAEAERMFRVALAQQPHDPWTEPALGHLLARTKRTTEAEAILAELQAQLSRGRLTWAAQALVQTGLGRTDEALAALERAWAERDDYILAVVLDPRLKPLHADSRFQNIVRKVGTERLAQVLLGSQESAS